jgi:hypothetical protein
MADQLEAGSRSSTPSARGLREATVRFGDALAATHDVDQLLRVIVETVGRDRPARRAASSSGLAARSSSPGRSRPGGETFELPLPAGPAELGTLTLSVRGFTVEQRRTGRDPRGAHAAIALENARLHPDRRAAGARRHAHRASRTAAIARKRSPSELMRAERFGGSVAFVLARSGQLQVDQRPLRPPGRRRRAGGVRRDAAGMRARDRRPRRWGGEEFAIVLPEPDLDGAAPPWPSARAARSRSARSSLPTAHASA